MGDGGAARNHHHRLGKTPWPTRSHERGGNLSSRSKSLRLAAGGAEKVLVSLRIG